jgi:hypothetical protein
MDALDDGRYRRREHAPDTPAGLADSYDLAEAG